MRRGLLSILVGSVILSIAPAARQAPPAAFTIEQVLSAPFPSDLVAAPSGRAVAWVFNDQGRRNVWVAEGPELTPRRLTSYLDDDGQELTGLVWTPDGSAIVFVRGGERNAEGEIPNPLNDPAGAEQAVWIAPLDRSAPRRVGGGHSPAVSPRGDRVAFTNDDEAWVAPLSGASAAQQLFTARGTPGSLAWSPDGEALAFVSNRRDHALVGIFHPGRAAIEYLSPSVDMDRQPRWSPDGRRLAFFRVAAVDGWPPGSTNPWSVMVATREGARFGRAVEIWRAPDRPDGSFARMLPLLEWADGDRLVFGSEHEGWAHLYAVDAARGGAATLLTPGDCEVESAVVAPGRRDVFFTSNCEDIDRRHVWKVSLPAGASPAQPERLVPGQGLEFHPVVTADGQTLVFLKADARKPALPHALSLKDGRVTAIAADAVPASWPAAQLVEPKLAIFKAADGWEIHGQAFEPPARAGAGRRPAIIFMHGGPPRQMLLGWHYMYYYHNAYGLNQYLASRGYLVLSVNFRSGIGYGRRFRDAPGRGAMGAAEYQDIVAASDYLRARPDVDPTRIGLWGGSYGGYLTALGLSRNSDRFAAGVDLHGVHDWSVFRRFSLGPGPSADATRLARESSPVATVEKWRSPVLLIHGDDDRNVDFGQTVDLVKLLRKHGIPFEQIVFPDEVHDFLTHRHWLDAYRAAAEFFDRKLGTGKVPSENGRR